MGNSFSSKQTPPNPQLNLLSQAQANLLALYGAAQNIATSAFVSITVDGEQVTYHSLTQITETIKFWERKVELLSGRRRRAIKIRLSGF